MSNKVKTFLHYISYLIIWPPLILAILLPQPYSDGITSDVFKTNITALILFIFLCLMTSLLGFTLHHFTNVITTEKVKTQINEWMAEINLQTLHPVFPKLIEIVNEAEVLDVKSAKQKQREYLDQLANAWEVEKNLNIETDLKLKEKIAEIEAKDKELDELRKFKEEKRKIDKMVKEQIELENKGESI